jgi:lysylphosphatidylglycerol synthetase-like protein (DUF2156 family)
MIHESLGTVRHLAACPTPDTFKQNGNFMMITLQEKMIDISPRELLVQVSSREAELLRSYGNNSLAFFGLAPENRHFVAPNGTGLVSYRLVNTVAVVLGDPVCAPETVELVTQSFLDFCARQNWRVAFYQASPEHLATYRALKLHAFKMGEEALLHPQTFTLRGSAMANVRTSARRAERDGITISWYDGVPPAAVMQQLELISQAWLEHRAGTHAEETGFSTGRLDGLIESAKRADAIALPCSSSLRVIPRLVTGVATTSAGTACAFVTCTPIYGDATSGAMATGKQSEGQGWGWSLDLMRRVPDASPGVMELLLVRGLERFRSCGAHVVSLGMVALADTSQEMTPVERQLVRLVTNRLHLLDHRETLFNFKQKFQPCWESRFLVTNTTLALPQIALAVLRLRNYAGGGVTKLLRGSDKP